MTKVFSDSALQLVLGQARASLDEVSETFLSKFGSNQLSGGRLWTNSVYFDLEAAEANGRVYIISAPHLLRVVTQLLQLSEPILRVQRYQTEVYGYSHVPQAILNHQFIVFETEGPWWCHEGSPDITLLDHESSPGIVSLDHETIPGIVSLDHESSPGIVSLESKKTMPRLPSLPKA
ncbi:hypothetical protein FHG87_003634 [Trinorchestia longiramus]|nr:hypothetical protein FHG87_003634 [Trinorchestia longiramus]